MGQAPGPPLELRRLRYFVAVAEELHFGRAADRLHITQPVLSRQIHKLEQELDTDLFLRTSRNVALTPAGSQLLEEARSLLAAAEASRRRMYNVAHGPTTLTVGFFVGDTFTPALRAFGAKWPAVAIELVRIYWHDQVAVLLDGRADVAFVHLPIDDHQLELLPVREERRVAVLPSNHPATKRNAIDIADLADDPVIIQRGASAAWQAFHNVDPRPDGRHPQPGPAVDNIEEKLQQAAAGRAVSFVPESAAAAYRQPGVAYIPVRDIPPIQICLAWNRTHHSPHVPAFVESVRRTRHRRARQQIEA